MGIYLFDDDVNNNDELEKIEINPEFAKRYEHNKKREDLQKYEEMKKKGIIDSGSESETDSDMDDVDDGADIKQVLDGILKIRKKDPSLLLPETKLFESGDDEGEDEEEKIKSKSKPKPKYPKDVIARNVIENGPDFDSEEEEEDERRLKTFVEEQEDLRKEVLEAIAAEEDGKDGDGDEFWNVKEKIAGDDEEEFDDELKKKLDEVFGEDDKSDKNDLFLRKYILEKMWIKKENNNVADDIDLSEDEEEVLKQEDYERDYNFRFEESKSDRVEGHSRHVDTSVRTVNNTRKEARKRKKEREMQAEMERAEEVKRLKNLKRKETEEKIKKIMEIAGVEDGDKIPLNEDYLDKDFDPVEFDKTMETAFGDEYYKADDVDSGFVGVGNDDDLDEKPDFEKEDELLGLPKNWDVIKSKDGFLAKREKDKRVLSDVEEENEEEEEEEVEAVEGKRKSKLAEALKKDLEEELYKYDYEDAIGDLKTRFKYQKVKPDRYKLTAAEILWLDEPELNQYVSLKKLATYREQDWKVPQNRKRMLIDGFLNPQSKQKRVKMSDGEGPSKMADESQSNEEGHKLSRSARRRQNRKEKKLPEARLVAYGKIPSKSSKSKN